MHRRWRAAGAVNLHPDIGRAERRGPGKTLIRREGITITEKRATSVRRNSSLATILVLSALPHASRVLAQDAPQPQGVVQPQDAGNDVPPLPAQGNSTAGPQQKLSYGADVGVGETDNVTLASTDKTSQTLAIADANIDVLEQRRLFSVDAKGDFSYLDFLQGAYGPELIGRFDGLGKVTFLPERLVWVVQEDFGQGQIDPFAPVTPTNQQNINYTSTGPDLSLRLGSLGFLNATARYARTTYQDSPFDSGNLIGTFAVGRFVSAGASASLVASADRALFDNTAVNADFTRGSLYGDYEAKGARTELTVNLGVTRVTQGAESFPQGIESNQGIQSVPQGAQSVTGPLATFKLSRRLSAAMKLTFTATRVITDASTSFSGLQSGAVSTIGTVQTVGSAGTVSTAPAPLTSSNYTATSASLNWEYMFSRTTIGLSGQWERDSYAGQVMLDVERATAQFSVGRKLSERFSAQLVASVYRTDYPQVDSTETNTLAGVNLTFQAPRGLQVRLRADHVSQTASGGQPNTLGSQANYSENRVLLTVGYQSTKAPAPYRGY
jgi:hypothetical protein